MLLTGARPQRPLLPLIARGLALLWCLAGLWFSTAVLYSETVSGAFSLGWQVLVPVIFIACAWAALRRPFIAGIALVALALCSLVFLRPSTPQLLNILLVSGWPLAAGILLLVLYVPRRSQPAER